jgi:peptidyl-lysine (3S)-dioxygenase / protease
MGEITYPTIWGNG